MSHNQIRPMTKSEIAELLDVAIDDIYSWAQPQVFGEWLDVCPGWCDRLHDEYDIAILALISQFDKQIDQDLPRAKRVELMRRKLSLSPRAIQIREMRSRERKRPEVARWTIVGGACLKYRYEWLKPLQPFVDCIVDFGCWASDAHFSTCSEPYALLWTMQASRVVVVDKEPEYISNAQSWLENTRRSHPDFRDYNLVFVAGDMSHPGLVEATDTLEGNSFQLAYCHDVLYNMYSSPVALRVSVNTMARVVKPGGWVIAIEPKMGVEHVLEPSEVLRGFSIPVPQDECKDISQYFEAAGLIKFDLENAPECSYCYQKKS